MKVMYFVVVVFFCVCHKFLCLFFKKDIKPCVSIKTYAYCHIALHISILYSWVGSYSWEPLIFVIKLKHKLIHWVY